MAGRKRTAPPPNPNTDNEDDEVVAELPVVLLPVPRRVNASASVNRIQFPQRRYWLRSMAHLSQQQPQSQSQRCFVAFKRNVKQLRVSFLRDQYDAPGGEQSATPGPVELVERCDTFTGEGFSQHQNLNYALGFARNDKLFLLPLEQHYEMHYANVPSNTADDGSRVDPLAGSLGAADASGWATTTSPPAPLPYAMAPVRIRFARVETDAQKRRREQSSLFKQRLVDQDPWVPLKLQKKEVTELCERDLTKVEKAAEERPPSTYAGTLRLRTTGGTERS